MRRFRFRLEGLLRLRGQFERAARRELAAATGRVAAVEQRIAVAEDGLRQCEEQGAGATPASRLARSLEQGLRRHRFRLQHALRAAEAQLDNARTGWSAARRDHRVLEQLRERRVADWRTSVARDEQSELEELARLRAAAGAGRPQEVEAR